ncbi:hypothetical protein FGSG_11771 [Fusarium graminearum PH-1]|uniref:hypothetical protein n=1 Tax=Gibberella zeae (strain ATCC MYA-4620 / CBS 123657 / FGSC 9075 / NRRL 31084 / PH-1) TaxID=229533 RepID=UPI00021F13B3|nr:hypothetical protein FGSG_11771 [Fusarium graminearum PH-1]ESU05661.1 hypothetical protein FGSG_11771 [Fusarium graminearum PH-1]|eukprot:XP_011316146.1 hypothetical protein FGSG_11771 [Fusarium graminearum PH-1]
MATYDKRIGEASLSSGEEHGIGTLDEGSRVANLTTGCNTEKLAVFVPGNTLCTPG